MQPEAPPLAVIEKNTKEDVRVSLSSFKGRNLIDIRTFLAWGDDPERRATRQGVSLGIDKLPTLIRALQDAAKQAGVTVE